MWPGPTGLAAPLQPTQRPCPRVVQAVLYGQSDGLSVGLAGLHPLCLEDGFACLRRCHGPVAVRSTSSALLEGAALAALHRDPGEVASRNQHLDNGLNVPHLAA